MGAGDFARDVAWWVLETDGNYCMHFVDDTDDAPVHVSVGNCLIPVIKDWNLPQGFDSYVMGVSDPRTKYEFVSHCVKRHINPHKTMIHESAVVAPDAKIRYGGIIGPNCRVGLNVELGSFVTMGPGCIIGHDTIIRDYCTLMPGSIVSGNCLLDTGVLVGAGAVIKEKISVGPWNKIGILAAVVDNMKGAEGVIRGVPARWFPEELSTYESCLK